MRDRAMKHFQIQTVGMGQAALPARRHASHQIRPVARRTFSIAEALASAPVAAPVAPPRTPWWIAPFAWIGRMVGMIAVRGDALPIAETSAPAVDEAEPAPLPAPLLAATPTHYRAFSLLQPRVTGEDVYGRSHPAIAAFRGRAKLIKEQGDQQVRDAACAVLDAFVALVDAFTPLWDAAGERETLRVWEEGAGDRVALKADMLATIAKLDAELTRILAPETVRRDRFETVQRFVDLRYGDTGTSDYGLVPA